MFKKKIFFWLIPILVLLFYPLGLSIVSDHHIQCILQKREPQDSLKCSYLAEVLGLSSEKKTSIYWFNTKKGKEKLLSTGIIKEASLQKIKPFTLFIDYELRKPVAYLADFENTVLDKEGILFPLAPFYSPKNLPEIYLGEEKKKIWGSKIDPEKLTMIHDFFSLLSPTPTIIDLSDCELSTLGQREIIIEHKGHLLRLSPPHYKEEILHYQLLQKKNLSVLKEPSIIDFRIPEVALIGKRKR